MSPFAQPQPQQSFTNPGEQENMSHLRNDDHNASKSSKRPPLTVKKQLFQTPATQPSKLGSRISKTPTTTPVKRLEKDSVTKRHFRHQKNSATITPNATRRAPRAATSTARNRPKMSHLQTTPGVRPSYVVFTEEMWRNTQIEDLTAWLNSELVDSALSYDCVMMSNVSDSAVFLKQVSAMYHLYKSPAVQKILTKIDTEVTQNRLFINKKIHLSTHHEHRESLISLLLLNYNPSWLLVGLSAILEYNIGAQLDAAVKKANPSTPRLGSGKLFMSVLEDAIREHFLADDQPGIDLENIPRSLKGTNAAALRRESYNALILKRVLHLVFLVDQAKQSRGPIILTDPPLFRCGSDMTSSKDVIDQMGKDFLPDHGDVARFLGHRLYKVTYETPLFERDSLLVTNLAEDLRDGTRLCKLASIMLKDRKILDGIRRVKNGTSPAEAQKCHLGNVSLALNKIQEHANNHLKKSFKWKGSHEDIVNQNLAKIVVLLWQVVGLWLETVVLDKQHLQDELSVVQNECREARKHPRLGLWSPTGSALMLDGVAHDVSPSRLTVYETCKSDRGHLLLRWCATVADMYGLRVRDFCESFRDGAVLCVILHHYCPALVGTDEIKPVQQADLRSVTDSEAEAALVQKNFDLFLKRCRSLGAIPSIPIRAEAALSRSFVSPHKDDSFGRVMEMLSSYLFRRLVMEKEGRTDREFLKSFIAQGERSITSGAGRDQESPVPNSILTPIHTGARLASPVLTPVDLNALDGRLEKDAEICQPPKSQHTLDAVVRSKDFLQTETHEHNGTGNRDDSNRHLESPSFSLAPASSLSKEEAAEIILRHYRCAKSRRQFLRMRSAAVDIQSSVRRFFVQSKQVFPRSEVSRSSQSTTTLCLKPWPEIAAVGDGLKGFVAEEANAKSTFQGEKPWKVIELVSSMLPLLRRHVHITSNFAEQMVQHENNQAGTLANSAADGQQTYDVAATTEPRASLADGSTSLVGSMVASLHGIVKNVPRLLISRANSESQVAASALQRILSGAEKAYEKAMNDARVRRELEGAAWRRKEELTSLLKDAARVYEEQNLETRRDYSSIERDLADTEVRMLDTEEFIRSLPLFRSSVEEEHHTSLDTSTETENARGVVRDDDSEQLLQGMNGLELGFSRIREHCAQEIDIEKDICHHDALWKAELDAEIALATFLSSRDQESYHLARERKRIGDLLFKLSTEEELEKQQLDSDILTLDDVICNLSVLQSASEVFISSEVGNSEKLFRMLNSQWKILQEADARFCLTESSENAALEDTFLTHTKAWDEYEKWLSEWTAEENTLDDKIRRQAEREKEHRDLLESRLQAAEEVFHSHMRGIRQLQETEKRDRAEREKKRLTWIEEDKQAKSELNSDFRNLENDQEVLGKVMESGDAVLECLTTPARAAIFPSPVCSPPLDNSARASMSPHDCQSPKLLKDMDHLVHSFASLEKDRVTSAAPNGNAEDLDASENPTSPEDDDCGIILCSDSDGASHPSAVLGDAPSPLAPVGNRQSEAEAELRLPTCQADSVDINIAGDSRRRISNLPNCSPHTSLCQENVVPRAESVASQQQSPSHGKVETLNISVQASPTINDSSTLTLGAMLGNSDERAGITDSLTTEIVGARSPKSRTRSPSVARILSPCENRIASTPSHRGNVFVDDATQKGSPSAISPKCGSADKAFGFSSRLYTGLRTPNPSFSTPLQCLLDLDRPSRLSEFASIKQDQGFASWSPSCSPLWPLRYMDGTPRTTRDQTESPQGKLFPLLMSSLDHVPPGRDPFHDSQSPSLGMLPMPCDEGAWVHSSETVGCSMMTNRSHNLSSTLPKEAVSPNKNISSPRSDQNPRRPEVIGITSSRATTPVKMGQGSCSRSEQFRRLSSQLGEMIGSSADGAETGVNFGCLTKDSMSSCKLTSVMRRISNATSSPRSTPPSRQEELDASNIVKIIFILIRECNRSSSHGSLVVLGLSIIRDMSKDACLVDSIFTVQDWLAVLVTCMYCYQDQEEILSLSCESLARLSRYEYGERVIRTDEAIVYQIRSIERILLLQASERQRTSHRLSRMKALNQALLALPQNGRSLSSVGELIHDLCDVAAPEFVEESTSGKWLSKLWSQLHMC